MISILQAKTLELLLLAFVLRASWLYYTWSILNSFFLESFKANRPSKQCDTNNDTISEVNDDSVSSVSPTEFNKMTKESSDFVPFELNG